MPRGGRQESSRTQEDSGERWRTVGGISKRSLIYIFEWNFRWRSWDRKCGRKKGTENWLTCDGIPQHHHDCCLLRPILAFPSIQAVAADQFARTPPEAHFLHRTPTIMIPSLAPFLLTACSHHSDGLHSCLQPTKRWNFLFLDHHKSRQLPISHALRPPPLPRITPSTSTSGACEIFSPVRLHHSACTHPIRIIFMSTFCNQQQEIFRTREE